MAKSMDVFINLELLTPSRKKPKSGDVFVLKPKGHPLYFGRVIRVDARPMQSFGKGILIYIYNATSDNIMNIPVLDRMRLLVPPMMTNRLGWSRGYFETVDNIPLVEEEDVLRPNCFWDRVRDCYRDEYGNLLPGRIEPCGDYALHSFRTIDDEVSEVLGIPLAPD